MAAFSLGALEGDAVASSPELVAPSVHASLVHAGLEHEVGVVEIDPSVSDTAATEATYNLDATTLANCIIVTGRRLGVERVAACVVASHTRADISGLVKRRMDVRKASFMPRETAVETIGMEFGGITPIGLPAGWPIYVEATLAAVPLLVLGSGIRRSKLLFPGGLLARIPGVELVEGLGMPQPGTA